MHDYSIKIILLGTTYTGKTTISYNFTHDKIVSSNTSTIGIECNIKEITLDNDKIIKIMLIDTSGQEAYKKIVENYYKTTCGYIIMYDITNLETFHKAKEWHSSVVNKNDCDHKHPIIMFGNKIDLEENRQVSNEIAREYAEENDILFYEISALDNININNKLKLFAQIIYDELKDENCHGFRKPITEIKLEKKPEKIEEKKCCVIS